MTKIQIIGDLYEDTELWDDEPYDKVCALCDVNFPTRKYQAEVISINGIPQPKGSAYTLLSEDVVAKLLKLYEKHKNDPIYTRPR